MHNLIRDISKIMIQIFQVLYYKTYRIGNIMLKNASFHNLDVVLKVRSITNKLLTVVATTHRNGTHSLLTSAKLSDGYLVVGITRELDKEPSLYCSSIYINTLWSILQQY